MEKTQQMETDTATEEREVLVQRGVQAMQQGHRDEITIVRDQLREYREQFQGDPAMAFVDENLRKLDTALGEESPDSYRYPENDSE
jgi:hypothetical protein